MNKQGNNKNPRGGIEWTHIFGPLTGFTANPVRGCLHDCKWRMGDAIVECYAKTQKERLDGPGSFEQITFHPEVLEEIRRHKKPAGIFIDSMSDLMGLSVKEEWINRVLETINDCWRHAFFILTKNPSRLTKFRFPQNVLVGISAPPTFMYGKELTLGQQFAWLRHGLECLAACDAAHRWISIEPLSFDISLLLEQFRNNLDWAVIGAGSNGSKCYQPDPEHFTRALTALAGLPLFFKGNIDLEFAQKHAGGWREEFPDMIPF